MDHPVTPGQIEAILLHALWHMVPGALWLAAPFAVRLAAGLLVEWTSLPQRGVKVFIVVTGVVSALISFTAVCTEWGSVLLRTFLDYPDIRTWPYTLLPELFWVAFFVLLTYEAALWLAPGEDDETQGETQQAADSD